MVQIVTSVKHTFVHVDVDIPDGVATSSNARRRTSSTPARTKLDAKEDEKLNACEFEAQGLELVPLLHDNDDYTMRDHPGPSSLDMDVEGMLGDGVPETDVDDPFWGLSFSQPRDEVTAGFVNAFMETDGTLSEETEDYSASARACKGWPCGARLPNGNYRESPMQTFPYMSSAPATPNEPVQGQLLSAFPISPCEEQRDSYLQSHSWTSPAAVPCNAKHEERRDEEERTTVMLMNVPRGYTSSKLMRTLDSEGFASMYDFIYVPMAAVRTSKGYAFVNCVSPSIAQRFASAFNGFSRWSTASGSVCRAVWATAHQGLQANVDHYRNSTVLGKSMPDAYKPRIFENGKEVPFPPPMRKHALPTRRVEEHRHINSKEALSR